MTARRVVGNGSSDTFAGTVLSVLFPAAVLVLTLVEPSVLRISALTGAGAASPSGSGRTPLPTQKAGGYTSTL